MQYLPNLLHLLPFIAVEWLTLQLCIQEGPNLVPYLERIAKSTEKCKMLELMYIVYVDKVPIIEVQFDIHLSIS